MEWLDIAAVVILVILGIIIYRKKKNSSSLMIIGTLLLANAACKEKKQAEEDIVITKYVAEKPQAPISQGADRRQTSVEWLGRQYEVVIERTPADSLPMVTDEAGQKYIDNVVRLSVVRSDSTVACRKTFTKGAFASYLDSDYRQQGILENMVFHKVEGPELKFAVVVGHPDSDDEFIPLELSLNSEGGIGIRRGNLLEEGDRGEDYVEANEED